MDVVIFTRSVYTLSFGIVSGLYENWQRNYAIWSENPNAYNFVNLYTHGLLEMADGALFSEETLSFQHVMDIIGTATLLFGAAKLIQGAKGGSLAGAAVGSIDDTLDDIARQNGKVEAVLSADDLNAEFISRGKEAPFLAGSNVYYAKMTSETKFARVFGGETGGIGYWLIKADDIKNLSKAQIRSKYSLPNGNAMSEICDVVVPEGTKIQISYAGPAFSGAGGGVQYRIIDDVLPQSWFSNRRSFS